jgi:hypothetical protein
VTDDDWQRAARAAVLRAARARLRPEERDTPDLLLLAQPWESLLVTMDAALAGSVEALRWLIRAAAPPLAIPLHREVAAAADRFLADPEAAVAAFRRARAAQRDRTRARRVSDFLRPSATRRTSTDAYVVAASAEGSIGPEAVRKAARSAFVAMERETWPGLAWTEADAPF